MKDFADEIPGYPNNRRIGDRLARLKLASGQENIGENLIRCYEEMIRIEVVGGEELALVKAWTEDIAGERSRSAGAGN